MSTILKFTMPQGVQMDELIWRLKWILPIAALGGAFLGYLNYQDGLHLRKILAEGAPAAATVIGGSEVHHRRGGTEYLLDVAWPENGERLRAEIKISAAMANRVFVGDRVTLASTDIKHLAADPYSQALVLADADQQIADKNMDMWVFIGAGIIGLIGSPIVFAIDSRRRKALASDIDETLAQMRARDAQAPDKT